MAWQIEIDDVAKKDLARLDKSVAKRITSFIRERLVNLDNPRDVGEALYGARYSKLWKYRVGDYRIITRIENSILRILVVRVGHRREIYR